jgi:squalene cyclase
MARFGSGGSGVVNTAWAMLALLAANCDDAEALRRGAAYLMSEQLPNGDWKQEGPNPNPNPSPNPSPNL